MYKLQKDDIYHAVEIILGAIIIGIFVYTRYNIMSDGSLETYLI